LGRRLHAPAAVAADVDVRQVPGVRTARVERAVLLALGIEVRARGREAGTLALAGLVDVHTLEAGRQPARLEHDPHGVAELDEVRGADGLALRIHDVGHRGVVGGRRLTEGRAAAQEQEQERDAGPLHFWSPWPAKSALACARS